MSAAITPFELLERACRRHAPLAALRDERRELTYGELRREALGLAAGLAADVPPGASVALLLRNCAEYAVADLALLALGAVKVPLNEYLSAADVAHALEHSEATAIIAHASLAAVAEEALARLERKPRCILVAEGEPTRRDGWDAYEAAARHGALAPRSIDPEAPALILYTGGTTGRPKGALHTRGALGLNLLSHVIAGEVRPQEQMLLSTPLPHSAGFHLQACLAQGGTATLLPRFDAAAVIRAIERRRIGWTFLVPTMLYRLLESPALARADTGSLATVVYGAAPIDPLRLRQALARFGPVFLQLYGQVECPNYVTTLSKQDHLRSELQTSCGQPVSMCEVQIEGGDGRELPPGEVGELAVRSPYLLREYHRAPEQTAASRREGWHHTGDLAYRNDSGYVFLVDRAKDMIISGGMNVYSREVEEALMAHAEIAAAAVFGVPHADWGEAVHAVIVARGTPSIDEIRRFCRTRLAAYKVPKSIAFADELPLTAYGKIDKKKLRQPHWSGERRAIH